jgi:hypothetical protein
MKIASSSPEEAAKYAESALKKYWMQPGEDMPADFVTSMGMTDVISSMLLGVQPEKDPKQFDMCGAKLEKSLEPKEATTQLAV